MRLFAHGRHEFDAVVEIPRHPVGGREEDVLLAAVIEAEDAAVLEEAADDAAHADVFADVLESGTQHADAAHDEVDFDACRRGFVEFGDNEAIEQGIHLRCDVGAFASLGVRDFPLDALGDALSERQRGDGEAVPDGRIGEAREKVEERRSVDAREDVGGEEADVGVDLRRRPVVVARREVAVAADAIFLAPYDHRNL